MYRGWRDRAAGGQVETGQMQENYFVGTSLCGFSGCAVLTMHLHQSLPERLELRISLSISQDSQLTNALGYCKGRSPVTVTKNWISYCKAVLARTEVQTETLHEKTENP